MRWAGDGRSSTSTRTCTSTSTRTKERLLLRAARQHHQVVLAVLALAEGEEHLDEQTVRRRRVGNHDRFGRVRVEALRLTNLLVGLARRLERVGERNDVEIVRAVALVLRIDARLRERVAARKQHD